MTPVLLLPAALAALTALVVPLVIHLVHDAELRRTDFAALRWLAARPRPRSRRQFDEWPLLALRLLLLALVALWLARPAVLDETASSTPWLAVVPGADLAAAPRGAARQVWLAPGFPPLDTPRPDGPIVVASLLRQLDAELPPKSALRVVAPARLVGADAERPRLARAVMWQVAGGTMPTTLAPVVAAPTLSVRYTPARAVAVRYFRAVAVAWAAPARAPSFDVGPPSQPLPPYPATLIWLVPGPLPAPVRDWITGGGTALVDTDAVAGSAPVVWRDAAAAALATAAPLGRGRIIRLTRPLDPAVLPQLLDPDFPQRLRTLLDAPRGAPTRVAAVDYAPLTGGATYPPPARDLRPWLALLIAALFLGERWLATARRARAGR